MQFDLDSAIALLSRTPPALMALLGGLPPEWLRANEGPGTWSPFDVVGHLIHGEKTDWIPRLRIILEHGESRPFEPFERLAQFGRNQTASIGELLDEFGEVRGENLATLQGLQLTSGDLAKTGLHPALGRVTASQLLSTWVAHDLDHLAQIARAMAKQYTGEVGPWIEYLSILRNRA